MGHPGAEGLQMPVLWTVKAELAVKAVAVDLGGHLEKDHPREAAAVGMGWVVVAGGLAVDPQIDHLQPVATRNPGTTPLGWLPIHHMADPAITGGKQNLGAELLHRRLVRP